MHYIYVIHRQGTPGGSSFVAFSHAMVHRHLPPYRAVNGQFSFCFTTKNDPFSNFSQMNGCANRGN